MSTPHSSMNSKTTDAAVLGPALLEYLRNLTPQVLILALAMVAWIQVDTTKSDLSWQGFKTIAIPCLLFALFCAALLANAHQFLERTLTASEAISIETTRLSRRDIPVHKKLSGLAPLIWKHDRGYALRAMAAATVLMTGQIALFAAVVPQAVVFLRYARAIN